MSDLDEKEQMKVRAALRYLRQKVGAWAPVAETLHCAIGTMDKVVHGRSRVSASLAFRVARLLEVTIDDLLAGRYLPPGACPHCGHMPDFTDEDTQVGAAQRPLTLVR